MADVVARKADLSDAELISSVRAGDTAAFGDLFERHRGAALRLARHLLAGTEAEDLVSEAFTKVLVQLQDGRGPDLAFRAYLLTVVRRLHVDHHRSGRRLRPTDDERELDEHIEFFDAVEARFESATAAEAFNTLPERWQAVLWHLDVEGQKPADIAPILGMSANSVSALAYRAREGLRQSYLQHHLGDTATGDCRWTTERLGTHVRKGLSRGEATKVEDHLDRCRRCMGIYLELVEVNANLSGILAPAILGAAATGYLAAGSAASGMTIVGATGIKALVGSSSKAAIEPVKTLVTGAGVQGVASAVVVATLVTAGAVAATGGIGPSPGDTSAGSSTTEPSMSATKTPQVTPSAAPSSKPTANPSTSAPTAAPSPKPVVSGRTPFEPSNSPPSSAPSPESATPTESIGPTDFGVGTVATTNDSTLLQRRITVPVTSRTVGAAKSAQLSLTVTFDRSVIFRGVVSPEWNCPGLVRGRRVSTMNCTRTQTGPEVPALLFKAMGWRPAARITITGANNADPVASNNSKYFRSGPWL